MQDMLSQVERERIKDRFRSAARAKKAQALARLLIEAYDADGTTLGTALRELAAAPQDTRDEIAKLARVRSPSPDTWSLMLKLIAATADDRERNPGPFAGLGAA